MGDYLVRTITGYRRGKGFHPEPSGSEGGMNGLKVLGAAASNWGLNIAGQANECLHLRTIHPYCRSCYGRT